MKLAFVHRRFGLDGGTERFLESLARRLAERGHDIDVFSASIDPRYARARIGSFHRLFAGRRGLLRNALLALAVRLQVRPHRFEVVVHFGRTGPLDVYRAGGGCHRRWFQLLLSRAESGWARLRLRLAPSHRFLLWHERRALGSPGRVVVPSELARRDMQEAWGELAEGVEVIHNGVDLDRFHPRLRSLFFEQERQGLGLRPEELVLLFVGSDFWRKGLDTVLRALASLVERGAAEDLRVLAVGATRGVERFERLADELGVRNQVSFLGHHPALERVYAASDLLVLPTRHDPFANVTLEALASGLSVVTSPSNGAVEAVGACEALRVLDDAEDWEGLASAVEELLATERLAERREAARAAAESCGELEVVGRWEQLLQTVARSQDRRV